MQVEWVCSHTAWFPEHKITIQFVPGGQSLPFQTLTHSNLILSLVAGNPVILRVDKMRFLSLEAYQSSLETIFQEFIIDYNGWDWRGHIQIPEDELLRWQLMCGS